MIVRPKHRALVLRTRNPERITSVIPTAKVVTYKGADLTVVPHKTQEMQVLRNLGYEPPAPVDYYYDWPGQFEPMAAQKDTVRFLTKYNRAYVLNGMGTGKSISTLWAFDHLRNEGLAKRMLVLAPLSTLQRTWSDEVFHHFPHLNVAVVHGTAHKRKLLLSNKETDVYVINHDGIKIRGMVDELIKRDDIDTIVLDELSQCGRNHGTNRWKALRKMTQDKPRLWGLTGTPIPNEPTDVWAQCRLITPETVPRYFNHFRMQTMKQVSTYKWVAKDDALDTVNQVMQPAIRFSREDCVDLPPVIHETREVGMTKDQEKLFNDMKARSYAAYQGGEITAVNAAVQIMRMVQIACGAAYDPEGKPVIIKPKSRIEETRQLIEDADSKVLVFVPFKSALKMVHDELSQHYTCAMIDGSVTKKARDEIIGSFQQAKDPRVLIAQPAAMSHGVTLTAASVVCWFAPITSAETYQQANARISRPGQKHSQLICHIEGTKLEHQLYQKLTTKTLTQDSLLDMFSS